MRRRINRSDTADDEPEQEDDSAINEIEEYPEDARSPTIFDNIKAFLDRFYWLKYVFVALITPPVINIIALRRESEALFPKQGEQIETGWGQKMFVKCTGAGLPTVILDAPTGVTSDLWFVVQEELSKVTQVCSYDRIGLGFSELHHFEDMSKEPKWEKERFIASVSSVEQMSCDLHRLVTHAKPLDRPFILVGSEIGGLIARYYSMKHPEDVSDIVLLDPLVEDLFWRQKDDWLIFWNGQMLPSLQSLQMSAYVGMSRIAIFIGWLKPEMAGLAHGLPKEIELTQLFHLCNPAHMGAVFHEHLLLNTSFLQMSELWDSQPFPGNISITVINSRTFDKIPPQLQKAWQQSQLYLRQSLHPTCQHFMFDGTTGELYKEPGVVVNKIQQLIFHWRLRNDFIPKVHTFREKERITA